jgi:hypothetical protein
MRASDAARALSNRRWAKEDARHKTRGKWTGERNPNFALSAEQKRAIAKRPNRGSLSSGRSQASAPDDGSDGRAAGDGRCPMGGLEA